VYGPTGFPKSKKFSPVHVRFNHFSSTKVSDTHAELWERMTVSFRSGGEFAERTDNVGDVTLFARGGAADKLSAVLVEYARDGLLAQSFAFCLGEDE